MEKLIFKTKADYRDSSPFMFTRGVYDSELSAEAVKVSKGDLYGAYEITAIKEDGTTREVKFPHVLDYYDEQGTTFRFENVISYEGNHQVSVSTIDYPAKSLRPLDPMFKIALLECSKALLVVPTIKVFLLPRTSSNRATEMYNIVDVVSKNLITEHLNDIWTLVYYGFSAPLFFERYRTNKYKTTLDCRPSMVNMFQRCMSSPILILSKALKTILLKLMFEAFINAIEKQKLNKNLLSFSKLTWSGKLPAFLAYCKASSSACSFVYDIVNYIYLAFYKDTPLGCALENLRESKCLSVQTILNTVLTATTTTQGEYVPDPRSINVNSYSTPNPNDVYTKEEDMFLMSIIQRDYDKLPRYLVSYLTGSMDREDVPSSIRSIKDTILHDYDVKIRYKNIVLTTPSMYFFSAIFLFFSSYTGWHSGVPYNNVNIKLFRSADKK